MRALEEVGFVAEAEEVVQPDRAVSLPVGCPVGGGCGRFEVQHPAGDVGIFQVPGGGIWYVSFTKISERLGSKRDPHMTTLATTINNYIVTPPLAV